MKNKVVILSSGHPPKDERIFSKIGYSLSTNGYSVVICTSTEELHTSDKSIYFDCFNGEKLTKREKINKFYSLLSSHSPDIIISSEPLPILAAHQFKKKDKSSCKVISDITEWYPENVAFKYQGIKKWFSYFTLYLFNLYTTNLADALIIGEEGKKKRYDLIAPFKMKEIVSYFPRLEFFPYSNFTSSKDEFNLGFTGILNKSRGFHKILYTTEILKKRHPYLKLKLTIVGLFLTDKDEELFSDWKLTNSDITIDFSTWLPYDQLKTKLSGVNLLLDLRELNFIFNNSLPIKIFEYMALGIPVIYSEAASLKNFFGDFSFGKLVDPLNSEEIISAIEYFLFHPEEIQLQGLLGRKLVEEKYQWSFCETKLLNYLKNIDSLFPAEKHPVTD
ncbi:MAG: glycosyltransferase [Ignavibacteriaceae bacterium]|jgi:glycosyltransferase involved in cell wall biosynthesis